VVFVFLRDPRWLFLLPGFVIRVPSCPFAIQTVRYFVRADPWQPWFKTGMECRPQCGACCIAPSITSPIPGMPHGKPAGIPCVQLLPDLRCALFGRPERPAFCASLRPAETMCRSTRDEALACLTGLERATKP